MNATKQIFLLSLLSVIFFSTFCQNLGGNIEIIYQANIARSAEADDEHGIDRLPYYWQIWNFYRIVMTNPNPFGTPFVDCYGRGPYICMPNFIILRGSEELSPEVVEKIVQNIITESDDRAISGEYKGSLTQKITTQNGKSLFLFQYNWDYDPKNIRNGKAEIIISKVNDFGLK